MSDTGKKITQGKQEYKPAILIERYISGSAQAQIRQKMVEKQVERVQNKPDKQVCARY
jgi:hypothetical protein